MKLYVLTEQQFGFLTNTVALLPGSQCFDALTMLAEIAKRPIEAQDQVPTNGAELSAESAPAS